VNTYPPDPGGFEEADEAPVTIPCPSLLPHYEVFAAFPFVFEQE